jgi:hypothetical protein
MDWTGGQILSPKFGYKRRTLEVSIV